MSQAAYRLTRISGTLDGGNAVEPVSLNDMLRWLKVQVPDDNFLVADLIAAAREQCESIVNRTFVNATWELSLGRFPLAGSSPFGGAGLPFSIDPLAGSIRLPRPPLVSVASITYSDLTGSSQTIDVDPAAGNVVVAAGTPGYLSPAFARAFPWTRPGIGSVAIRYTAGYGTTRDKVPRSAALAIRMLTSTYYFNRSTDVSIPDAVYRLLDTLAWTA